MSKKTARLVQTKKLSPEQARGVADVVKVDADYRFDRLTLTTKNGARFDVSIAAVVRAWERQLKWAEGARP